MDTKALFEILARRTSENAQIIGNFSAQAADQQRSSIDSIPLSKELFPTDVPDDVQRARASLLEALWELQQLCLGPSEFLEQHQVYVKSLIHPIALRLPSRPPPLLPQHCPSLPATSEHLF